MDVFKFRYKNEKVLSRFDLCNTTVLMDITFKSHFNYYLFVCIYYIGPKSNFAYTQHQNIQTLVQVLNPLRHKTYFLKT